MGAVAVAVVTVAIFPLREVTPAVSTGVLYLLAVLLAAVVGGRVVGAGTAVASALAFNLFHLPPTGTLRLADDENWVALVVFVAAAVAAGALADLARARAAEADARLAEATLVADAARLMVGAAPHRAPLGELSARIASTFGLRAVTLTGGDGGALRLRLPDDVPASTRAALDERVLPAFDALLTAAAERDRLAEEVAETEALRRSDSVKTALLRAVGHDLRSPLTAIRAAAPLLATATLDDDDRRELGQVVDAESARLARLVEDLLDLSRIEAGAAAPRVDWCDLADVAAAAVGSLGERAAGVVVDAGDEPGAGAEAEAAGLVRADPAQLERAVANLVDNALTHGAAPVRVTVRRAGAEVAVRVTDHGTGIPAGELDRVRLPFQGRGTGLGLAIAAGFAEANGGRLVLESLPGQGTSAAVVVPR